MPVKSKTRGIIIFVIMVLVLLLVVVFLYGSNSTVPGGPLPDQSTGVESPAITGKPGV